MSETTVQILLDLKSADAVALTALEAICNLLGYGDRLTHLRRRSLTQLWVESPDDGDAVADAVDRYLSSTVAFWNSNKERAWLRAGSGIESREVHPGSSSVKTTFGEPSLDRDDQDHLLVWNRESDSLPGDLEPALAPSRLRAFRRVLIYTFSWGETATPERRREWIERVAVVRSRSRGLLVHPHYQDHQIQLGAIPVRLPEISQDPRTDG